MNKNGLLIALLAIVIVASAYRYASTPNGHAPVERLVVAVGENTDAIVNALADDGIIRSKTLFKLALKQSGMATQLQPGEYDMSGVASFGDIISRLTAGGVRADEATLQIIEGWNLSDIAKAVSDAGLSGSGFASLAGAPPSAHRGAFVIPEAYKKQFAFLADAPRYATLEGYAFPDKYRFYKTASADDVVTALLKNFDKKTADVFSSANPHSRRDILTMASIIEREVQTPADRRIVADIFWRRLGAHMALQADSTVNYATGKSLASVTAKDLEIDSPYNTYKYPGLPPGPICNPGLDAIMAAAAPTPNDYWYFLTDAQGVVHYAKTLDEQTRNKFKYLR